MAIETSIVAYWKLDESSGNASDEVNSNTLTNVNTATFNTGKINNGAYLASASDQYFTVADNAALSMGNIDFSIAFWVYLTDANSYDLIMSKATSGTGSDREYWFDTGETRTPRFMISDGSSEKVVTSGTTLSTATWYYIVGWHDATANTVNIQVNNGTVDSIAHTTGGIDGSGPFNLGNYANQTGGGTLNGRLDEVGIWKKVLTSDERTDLYNSGSGLQYPFTTTSIKSINGLAKASIKSRNGLAIGSIKSINGLS